MMKKLLASTLLVMSLGTSLPALANDNVNVKVNGSMVNFPDAKPYIDESNDRTMVPARFISEALGYQVFWNEANRKVIIQKTVNGKGFIVTLKEGENKAEVDGKQVTFDAKAVIKDKRTFVPLRFVSESFGADVDWVEKENLVVITTGDGAGTGNIPGNSAGTTTPPTGGTGTTPGTSPSNGTGMSPSAGTGEKVGVDKQFTVVAPSDPNMLLPKDAVTEPAIDAFLASLKYENGVVSGKVPKLPTGHTINFHYVDTSDGKWGVRENDREFNGLKAGDTFSAKVAGKGGFLSFSIFKGAEGKNGLAVKLPDMTVEFGAKR
ncbi:copper amine oxidase N-terminal domain-containing protein (plasmid) [Brevibacillus sp. M2.1A]|uniref:copper amine oxidase N-terminal domain-containing protein n=1 Tax=Brevibacillus sp. M2.1A TaxID=2738980 RepID=UPI00156BA2E9|nr:copper amine oxidase N-terminal domain-containing protein [Brevibacillus sp. M2.1A]MCC8438721.1 copper amine oxidase N-terminal domain-containing protein [Brevibacillus sp. M2.1A]